MAAPVTLQQDAAGLVDLGPGGLAAPLATFQKGISSTWVTTGGFTGTPALSGNTANRFGNLVKYSCDVTGLTAAPGLNTATMTLPIARIGAAPFGSAADAAGVAAGTTAATGALAAGPIAAASGAPLVALALTNGTGAPMVLDGGIQCTYKYYLV
jgi:hypothetical protein